MNFSFTELISLEGVSKYLEGVPRNFQINLHNCSRVFQDVENETISVDLFVDLVTLVVPRVASKLLSKGYGRLLEDSHIQKLIEHKKIDPHAKSLDLG